MFVNVTVGMYIKETSASLLMTYPNDSLFNFVFLSFKAIIPLTLVQTGHLYSMSLICDTTVHFTLDTTFVVNRWTFGNTSYCILQVAFPVC